MGEPHHEIWNSCRSTSRVHADLINNLILSLLLLLLKHAHVTWSCRQSFSEHAAPYKLLVHSFEMLHYSLWRAHLCRSRQRGLALQPLHDHNSSKGRATVPVTPAVHACRRRAIKEMASGDSLEGAVFVACESSVRKWWPIIIRCIDRPHRAYSIQVSLVSCPCIKCCHRGS